MSDQTTLPAETARDDVDYDGAHWSRPMIEAQLELLGHLADIGLNIARAVERQAMGQLADGEPPVAADVSLAYARVSRAVRMTIALQSRLIVDLNGLEEGETRQSPDYVRKGRVERILKRVIKAEHHGEGEDIDEEVLHDRVVEAGERLDDEDLYGDVASRPISEILAQICKDLGLSPDWPSLAQEPWALGEIESGAVGWPLRPPPQSGGGGPLKGVEGACNLANISAEPLEPPCAGTPPPPLRGPPPPQAGEDASP